ncbi:MAG TPA: secretin N-terminal domain-containing protein, partial [Bacillota bacterium]|nr:secretin N-terminal domain-containing protein [Bacillota bacterium]
MAKQGLLLKWGFVLLLLISSLSLAVQGAQPDVATTIVSNFDVFEADLRDVFRTLAEYGQINILLDKQVQGIVTTRFQSGMTVKQAIEILAQTNGYSFRWMMPQRTVLIGNENTFKGIDAQQTKIFSLKYADPDTVTDTLKVIVPKEQIGVDKRTNQLVVKANMLELQNIEEVVGKLDREMPQISIELRIEEVKRSALDEVGVVWDLDKQIGLDFLSPKI